ncbi:MAG TPA: adenylyl-sulfate kinase [Phycisphaerales bacterium]|nr:adenylyl-sulfate kinase [Phycisphaerales bacterium]
MTQVKATNIHWHEGNISRDERWKALGVKGATMWFTGLSACGKSTIACALEQALVNQKVPCYRLDGDNIRFGLNKNLGFSAADREENIRRIGEVSKLFADAGLITLTSFISPYIKDRDAARALHKESGIDFIEVFVDTPIDVCEQRDPKGLYKKARAALAEGKGLGFTGIDDPYEAPKNPELVVKAAEHKLDACVKMCLKALGQRGLIEYAG